MHVIQRILSKQNKAKELGEMDALICRYLAKVVGLPSLRSQERGGGTWSTHISFTARNKKLQLEAGRCLGDAAHILA